MGMGLGPDTPAQRRSIGKAARAGLAVEAVRWHTKRERTAGRVGPEEAGKVSYHSANGALCTACISRTAAGMLEVGSIVYRARFPATGAGRANDELHRALRPVAERAKATREGWR